MSPLMELRALSSRYLPRANSTGCGMEITYRASDEVLAVIRGLGRTEDIRFSPSGRRLAIAAFNRGSIAILGIGIERAREVALTSAAEISSSVLNHPHGVDFLDEDTIAVANRNGSVAIFAIGSLENRANEVSPIHVLPVEGTSLLASPGSLAAVRGKDGMRVLLVCNNTGHTVTRHILSDASGRSADEGAVLLSKWLNLPDGICATRDGSWIAISNHNTHNVLLYRSTHASTGHAAPDGILRGAYYPHGLRFSPDGRYIFVADAGAPFVHVYARGENWNGTRTPTLSVKVMDDEIYRRGRQNPQEGGPKGIDMDPGMNVLVATSEHQPLAMFDVRAMLADLPAGPTVHDIEYELGILAQADRLRVRVAEAEARAARAEAKAAKARARLARVKNRWPQRTVAAVRHLLTWKRPA